MHHPQWTLENKHNSSGSPLPTTHKITFCRVEARMELAPRLGGSYYTTTDTQLGQLN